MKRGEVWTVAGAHDYAGKPRPAVVLQDEVFDALDSVTLCPITTTDISPAIFRVAVDPTDSTGLRQPCFLMVDKMTTVSRRKMGKRLGVLDPESMSEAGRAIATFLRLGG